jgi:hypothetical protein
LNNIAGRMIAAAMGMQDAEMAPTAAQLLECSQQQAAYSALMAKWFALKANAGGQPAPAAAVGQPAAK